MRSKSLGIDSPLLSKGIAAASTASLVLLLVLANRGTFDEFRFAMIAAVGLVALALSLGSRATPHVSWTAVVSGGVLLAAACWRTAVSPDRLWASVAVIPIALGVGAMIAGWSGLRVFWREGVVLALLLVSPFVETVVLELAGIDLSPATASVAARLLSLLGWPATAQDVIVAMPGAWIVVSQGCSGLKTIFFLIAFSFIVQLVYPLSCLWRKGCLLAGAAVIGYGVNAVRVAILVLLAAPGNESAFVFWHVQQGAMVFEVIAVAIFFGLVYLLLPASRPGGDAGRDAGVPKPAVNEPPKCNAASPALHLRAGAFFAVSAGILGVVGKLLFFPQAAASLPPVSFSAVAPLPGWQAIRGEPDPMRPQSQRFSDRGEASEVQVEFQFIPDLSVHYIRNPDLELRFLPRAHLPLDAGLQHYASPRGIVVSNLHRSERATSALTPGPDGSGYWSSRETEHLSAIVTQGGDVSISPRAVAHSLYLDHLSIQRVVGWLFARETLPDPRCVLIHLSTASGPEARPALARAWAAWRAAYHPDFPAPTR